MKRRVIGVLLTAAMVVSLMAGCAGSSDNTSAGVKEEQPSGQEPQENTGSDNQEVQENIGNGNQETLEFYHGYYHAESEWPAAKVMRDIYDEFAEAHSDGPVIFKPIAVENRDEIISAQVAGGSFPDIVDAGTTIPQAAIAQALVYDLKPFIDENNLQDAVGLNYIQNDIDGHIYTVHDQLQSRGIWYNADILEKAEVNPETLSTWDGFAQAMESVRGLGDGTYGYAAGQGSCTALNALLGTTGEGRALLESELTVEGINSPAFEEAFKTVARMDQANGSDHTTENVGNLMDDFNKNSMAAVLFNGVWNASGIAEELSDAIQPTIYPGSVAVSSAGAGLTISSGMSEEKTELALEFLKYMTSAEVQEKIFSGVQANPCNTTLDLNQLAAESGDAITVKLAEACSLVNGADIIVRDLTYVWGSDVSSALINALMECAVSGADIDARFEQLKQELTALIS